MDNTVTKLYEKRNNDLTTLFPSAANPKNFKNAVFKYGNNLTGDIYGRNVDNLDRLNTINLRYYSLRKCN